jgi:hypothetical protein
MSDEKEKLGTLPFVLGGLSFIPLIGVIFGIITLTWGATTSKVGGRKLAMIGASGIAFTFIIYGALFYFGVMQRDGVYDELRSQLGEATLTSLVQAIEFYKVQNGEYPENLEILRESLPENSLVFIIDPTDVNAGEQRYFHYALEGDSNYYLLGVGPDGVPYTSDDLVPHMEISPGSNIGLLIHKDSASAHNK